MTLKTHYTNEITPELDGKKVTVAGWLHDTRKLGKLLFVILRDARGTVQITFNEGDLYNVMDKLGLESVISVECTIKKTEKSKRGVELIPSKVTVLSEVKEPFPITLTGKTNVLKGTMFEQRHLSIRMPAVVKTMEIKAEVLRLAREFLNKEGLIEIIPPIIAATATEGGSELFKVDYYGQPAYLAQSSQLYKQASISMHEKVFDIAPCFRAEKSKTSKHMSEFWQIDSEVAFETDKEDMERLENLIQYVAKGVSKMEQVKELNPDFKVPKTPFKKYSFTEAIDYVKKLGFKESYDEDWSTPAEIAMAEKHTEPFFVTDFPVNARGIHYALNENNPKLTKSFDLIWPKFGEGATGGLREHKYENLLVEMKRRKMNVKDQQWYLDMFKFGMPPHAGFGLGVERMIRWICNLEHVREAMMFPRTIEILKP